MSFECYVDSTMRVFFEQLDKLFVRSGDVCDLGKWLQMFAFDVIGEITFLKRLGFLENAEDVAGIMNSIWQLFRRVSPVSSDCQSITTTETNTAIDFTMPWVDWLWGKNPILQRLQSVKVNPIIAFADARAKERLSVSEEFAEEDPELNSRDFLSRFIEALAKDKEIPRW